VLGTRPENLLVDVCLWQLVGVKTAVFVASTVVLLAARATNGLAKEGRFQLSTDLLEVIDTETGALSKAESNPGGGYVMVPVPYRVP
jgi:hypothetical protein